MVITALCLLGGDLRKGVSVILVKRRTQIVRRIGLRHDIAAADIRIIRLGESRGRNERGKSHGSNEHFHDTSPCCKGNSKLMLEHETSCPPALRYGVEKSPDHSQNVEYSIRDARKVFTASDRSMEGAGGLVATAMSCSVAAMRLPVSDRS